MVLISLYDVFNGFIFTNGILDEIKPRL